MSNVCVLSTTALAISTPKRTLKLSHVRLDLLPVEIISIILDHLVVVTDSIPPNTDLDIFIQGCLGARKPIYHRVYDKSFISLMAVNRLFRTLLTLKIYENTILVPSDDTSVSINRDCGVFAKSDIDPFVFHDGSVFKEGGSIAPGKHWYPSSTLTVSILNSVQNLYITGQDRWHYNSMIYQLLDWSTLSVANNLKYLTIETKVFSFIYNEHYNSPFLGNEEDNYWSIYEKLLTLKKDGFDEHLTQDFDSILAKSSTPGDLVAYKLQRLSNTFAKVVASQKHKMTCTLIHNYHRLPNFSSLIWAFEKQKILNTIETLVIQHSIRGISSFLFVSHLALLKNLRRFCFDSYMNFESSLFTTLEKLDSLEQLLFDTSFTSLPMEPFRLPRGLQKLVITEKILFHSQLEFHSHSFDNLVELHLNFRSGFYNSDVWHQEFLEKLKLKSLKTLVAKGETQDNSLLLAKILHINPGISTFSLSIPSLHKIKIWDILLAMNSIKCFSIYFGMTMSDPSENIQSSSLISNILANLPSLEVLILDSGDLSFSLKRLIQDIAPIDSEKCPKIQKITIYHTNYNNAVENSSDVMDCFEESTPEKKLVVPGIDPTEFMKVTDVVPSPKANLYEFPLCKLDIDVRKLKEVLLDTNF